MKQKEIIKEKDLELENKPSSDSMKKPSNDQAETNESNNESKDAESGTKSAGISRWKKVVDSTSGVWISSTSAVSNKSSQVSNAVTNKTSQVSSAVSNKTSQAASSVSFGFANVVQLARKASYDY